MDRQAIFNAVNNTNTLADLAELINDGGTAMVSAAELAGGYAHLAAEDAGFGHDDGNHEAHLDVLSSAGADINYDEALAVASALAQGDAA